MLCKSAMRWSLVHFVTSPGGRSHSGAWFNTAPPEVKRASNIWKNIVGVITGLNMRLFFCDTEQRKCFFEIIFSPEYFLSVCDVCLGPQALSQRDAPHRNFFFFDGLKGSGVVDYFGPKWTQWTQSRSSVVFCVFVPSPLVFVTIHQICSVFWILSQVLWDFFVCFLIKQHSLKVLVLSYCFRIEIKFWCFIFLLKIE